MNAQIPNFRILEQEKDLIAPNHVLKLKNETTITLTHDVQGSHKNDIVIATYDKDFKLKKETIQSDYKTAAWDFKRFILQDIKVVDNKIIVILLEHKDNKILIYKSSITENFKPGSDLSLIGEFDKGKSAKAPSFLKVMFKILTLQVNYLLNVYDYDYNNKFLEESTSSDYSKKLIYRVNFLDNKFYLDAICLDQDLNKKFSIHQELSQGEKKNDRVNMVHISNSGDVIFGYVKNNRKSGPNNGQSYSINKITNNGKKFSSKDIEEKKEFFDQDDFSTLSSDQSKIFIFFKILDPKLDTRIDELGVCMIDINKLSLTKKTNINIDNKLISSIYTSKEAKKNKVGKKGIKNNLRIVGVHSYSDQGFIVILNERDAIVSGTYKNGNQTSTIYTYTYGDLMLIKFNENNQLEWSKIIKKKVNGDDESNNLSKSYLYKDKVFLFYNDYNTNSKNQELQSINIEEEKSKSSRLANLNFVIRSVSKEGEIDGGYVNSFASYKESYNLYRYLKVNPELIAFNAFKNKKQRIGFVYLDQNTNSIQNENSNNKKSISSKPKAPTSDIDQSEIKDSEDIGAAILEKIRKQKEETDRELRELNKE